MEAINYEKAIKRHLTKTDLLNVSKINGIDCIYIINLEQRPEKLEQTLSQLIPFGIEPNRLAATYGWTLSDDVFEDIGLKLQPGMSWQKSIFLRQNNSLPVTQPCYGSAIFYPRMSHGAVGTAISHLSVLQSAYLAGFQSIWVLEDDVTVRVDPHSFSHYIGQLENIVGTDGWDVLYTDDITHFEPFTPGTVWRPDLSSFNFEPLYEYQSLGAEFYRIGGRCQAHSMIIRRSGIIKILDFVKNHGIYLPYDLEIAFVPHIRLFNLKTNIVYGGTLSNSDTIHRYF